MNTQTTANVSPDLARRAAEANLDQARELYAQADAHYQNTINTASERFDLDLSAKLAWLESQLAERAEMLRECELELQALDYREGLGLDVGHDEAHFRAAPERCAEVARECGASAGELTRYILKFAAALRAQTERGYKTTFLRETIRDHRAALWAVYHAPELLEFEEEASDAWLVWEDDSPSPANTNWVREGARVIREAV